MFLKLNHRLMFFLSLAVLLWIIAGCGGGTKQVKKEDRAKGLVVTYEDVPPGALPDVPAELGGEGFTGEGWQTNEDYPTDTDTSAIPGGSVTWAIFEFPSTLRLTGKDSNSMFVRLIVGLVFESLLSFSSISMEQVPSLATHWKISEDFRTYWFRINPNARFSDGSRVTTEDWIATWKLRTDPGILSPYENMIWSQFEEPFAESPYIIRVNTNELNWKFFLYFGSMSVMPAKYIGSILFYNRDLKDPLSLAVKLRDATDPVSKYVNEKLTEEGRKLLEAWDGSTPPSYNLRKALLEGLNRAMQDEIIYNEERFAQLDTTSEIYQEIKSNPEDKELVKLNKKLIEMAYSDEIAESRSVAVTTGKFYMKDFQFEMPPGSGPYILDKKHIKKGRSLTIMRRTDYWNEDNPKGKGGANFKRIKFSVVNDERLTFEKFKKGEFDFYVVGRAQWWKDECDFENIKRGLVQKRKIYNDEPQGISGFVFNMREQPFDDKRMRQAFAYLFDREKLMSQLFFNEYIHTDSYHPGSVYENLNNPKYRYDPDKAVELLAECGWKERDDQGWLVNDRGGTLNLNLTYAAASFERILTIYQEDLKDVGIKLNLSQSQGATMFKMVSERKFKLHWQSWGGLLFPNPENDVSSWTADPLNTNNLSGVKNDRIDELIKEYNICFNQERRVEMIQEIDAILMDIQPYALGWYAPFQRVLYWNRFGQPPGYFSRTGDWRDITTLWWVDPEKEARLKKARKDKSIQLEVGETIVDYWPKWNEKHGRKYAIKGF